jgi:hypothetical protein
VWHALTPGAAWLLLALAFTSPSAAGGPEDAGVAGRILGAAIVDSRAYDKLAYLSDRIGHRLSGSDALERAVAWATQELGRDGIERVWTEKVLVPRWVRGEERVSVVAPVKAPIAALALGGSVGTSPEGVEAEVVEAASFEQLDRLGEAVRGKIVLFNKPIQPGFGSESGYGSAVGLRVHGASRAAKHGAVAMLLRSLGTASFRLPHTGAMAYDPELPKIPAAAISAEDAGLLQRLLASGDRVKVRMVLGCQTLPDVESANVLAELPGRERPEEIVLIGAHLDTWDVGQGALDDGAGCAIVMESMRLIRKLQLRPRRTIRAVLFTNEENGLRGGRDYAARHAAERHVAAIELDSGAAAPIGFSVTAGEGGVAMLRELLRPLAAIGAAEVEAGGGGADISPLKDHGVPLVGLMQDSVHYFDYHHTEADTLDKVRKEDLDRNVAAMALLAYLLAEREETLPPPE